MKNQDQITVFVRNWEDYKGRGDVKHNSWFRCSNRLLEDPDFFEFSAEEVLVWIYILSLSSQKNAGTVSINFSHALRVCRLKKSAILSSIEKMKGNQIDLVDVTDALRARNGHVTDTCATDRQTDRQTRESSGDDPLPRLVKIWNENCGPLPKVKITNPQRTKKAQRIFLEASEEVWVETIQKIAASNFCRGETDRGWRATFDWLLRPDTRLKVLEGKYDNHSPTKKASGIQHIVER